MWLFVLLRFHTCIIRWCSQDTDLVPSDIAAGLALLHQEQDKKEQSRDPDVITTHSPSSPLVSPAAGPTVSWSLHLYLMCFLDAGRGFGDRAGEGGSLYAVCGGCVRLAHVHLFQPSDRALQAHQRLVREYKAFIRELPWLNFDLCPVVHKKEYLHCKFTLHSGFIVIFLRKFFVWPF